MYLNDIVVVTTAAYGNIASLINLLLSALTRYTFHYATLVVFSISISIFRFDDLIYLFTRNL